MYVLFIQEKNRKTVDKYIFLDPPWIKLGCATDVQSIFFNLVILIVSISKNFHKLYVQSF